jgi:NADPH-dependent 2,4-dienoyl-CoA reductase/sulfur reductase-like enzyme
MSHGVVVIGAGQAGGRAIEALRGNGYTLPITLIGSETHLPYERPPLSKEMLLDTASDKIDWVRPASWYAENDVTLRLGETVTKINRDARSVTLQSGAEVSYDTLILATGATPRALPVPGGDHPRCHTIRTLEDSRSLRRFMVPNAHIVVIGAGFIGLEAAAAARAQGCHVTVLEAAGRVMARGVPARISEIYTSLHRDRGVDLQLGVQILSISGGDDAAIVHLEGGSTIRADAIVVGIGVVPEDGLAASCGLATESGIVVDDHGRTSDPCIYAAGDVTRHFNPLLGISLRLESWQNAQNQAIAVARNIAGLDTIYAEVPWFWSDQFGINMQITGLPAPDATEIIRGDLDGFAGLLLQLEGNRIVCAIGLNASRDLRFAKQIIATGAAIDPTKLADPAVKLADLYRAAKAA